ncbi:MAG: hypothetical protein M0Z95_27830, partial [Actinomycetota bacterium]|nr:hypothetical protein [Actinomycetota bacterium]
TTSGGTVPVYWLVASDGGIFSFGGATFYGSMGGKPLDAPVVGMAATPTGAGYWEVAADGGIFSFGAAKFYGSMGGKPLDAPVVGMAATPTGAGYSLVASDGGIFSFGAAKFYGSLGSDPLSRPVVGMALSPAGNGYWLTDDNGAVSAFGQAGYFGSAPQVLNKPIVGIAEAAGNGTFAAEPYPPGSYGYDVSVFQCGHLPPSPHAIGVVEVNGNGTTQTAPNPCLAQEATWAGAGLNLYDYLTYGSTSNGPAACQGNSQCSYGFKQAQSVFQMARQAGVDTSVAWWLDVETPANDWSGDQTANLAVVQGALLGIRSEGVNTVGIYASPALWSSIVGTHQLDVPYWMAWYTKTVPTVPTGGGGPYNCAHASTWAAADPLPGPVVMTQYSSDVGATTGNGTSGFDGDYTC